MSELVRLEGLEVHFPIRGGLLDWLRAPAAGRRPRRRRDRPDDPQGRGPALVGESGSGKTTTGRVIVKLTRQTGGRIVFDGHGRHRPVGDRRPARLPAAGPDHLPGPVRDARPEADDPRLRGRAARGQRPRRRRPPRREAKVVAALEAAGLRPATDFAFRFPHELSGGQRQRVVIAGALVMDPELIVADEPVSMLDVSIRTELLRLMLDLRQERGLTYLFITHDLSLAWVIADRIAVMYLGRIMEIGPAEAVIKDAHNPYTQGARQRVADARAGRRRRPGRRATSWSARRPTRRRSRPAAASIRAARSRSTAAGSRSRRCSTSGAASRRPAGWPRAGASCRPSRPRVARRRRRPARPVRRRPLRPGRPRARR